MTEGANYNAEKLGTASLQAGIALAQQIVQVRDHLCQKTGDAGVADVFAYNMAVEALSFVSLVYLKSTGHVVKEDAEKILGELRTKIHSAVTTIMGEYADVRLLTVLPKNKKGGS